jgi:hypothetical protein
MKLEFERHDQPTRAYLTLIARDPDHVNQTLNPKAN